MINVTVRMCVLVCVWKKRIKVKMERIKQEGKDRKSRLVKQIIAEPS